MSDDRPLAPRRPTERQFVIRFYVTRWGRQFAPRFLLQSDPTPIAQTPGTRLGPYEITAQIGVGEMGEVYRARDTKLKRGVAVKVLPESVAGDAERLTRFQRELKSSPR